MRVSRLKRHFHSRLSLEASDSYKIWLFQSFL